MTDFPQPYRITRSDREALLGQQGHCVWLTGLSGAGKSTLANALETALHARGLLTHVIDGDNLRRGLCRDLGFTPADRDENVRRAAEVAALLHDAGVIVIVALISPFSAGRAAARALFPPGRFSEVFVDTPLAECAQRDPKGIYAAARSGRLSGISGMDLPYERPDAPELRLTPAEPAAQAETLTAYLLSRPSLAELRR